MPNAAPDPYRKRRTPTAELSDERTRNEVAEVLASLRFDTEFRLLSLDRGTRDFLVRILRARRI